LRDGSVLSVNRHQLRWPDQGNDAKLLRHQLASEPGGAAVMWPLAARPQVPNKRPVIGLLLGGSEESTRRSMLAFQRSMRDCGYRTGFNYASFDDLVGAQHENGRDFVADRLSSLEVDYQLEPDAGGSAPQAFKVTSYIQTAPSSD
jgi:hypothetical protein